MTGTPKLPTRLTSLTRMGVRAYRQDIPRVIREGQPVLIERHGQPVGLYLPLRSRDEGREAQLLQALSMTLAELQERTGLSEESLAQLIEDGLREND